MTNEIARPDDARIAYGASIGWKNRWWIVVASVCGLIVGNGTIIIFAFGVFLKPITADLGLGRGTLAAGVLLANSLNGLALPVVGILIDRWGCRKVMLPGIALFALMVAAFSRLQASPLGMVYLFYGLLGLFGAVQSTVPYARTISKWFDRERGLALGIGLTGVGLGVAIVPQFAEFLIRSYGWRTAFVGLGLLMFVLAFVPVFLFIREPSEGEIAQAAHRHGGDPVAGLTAAHALRSWRFWALAVGFCIGATATNGPLTHLVAMLTDRGFSVAAATEIFSSAGIAMIIGRILCGCLLDRFHGPYVAVVFFLVPLLGIGLIASGEPGPVPAFGAVLCGLGIGAQVGLQAFFVGRYFGLKAYGKIYGMTFAMFLVGSGLGPYLGGLSFDLWRSYGPAFLVFAIMLLLASILIAPLGPYAFASRKSAQSKPPQMPATVSPAMTTTT
jgi:MFS family permease